MAHIGRTYKLLFRRDIATNVLNRSAYSDQYKLPGGFLTVGMLPGTTYSWSAKPFNRITAEEESEPEWKSDPITSNGKTFTVSLVVRTDSDSDGWRINRFVIRSGGVDRAILANLSVNLFGAGYYAFLCNNDPAPELWDAAYWGGALGDLSIYVEAKTW